MLQLVGSSRVTWLKEFELQAAAICAALLSTPRPPLHQPEVRKSERGTFTPKKEDVMESGEDTGATGLVQHQLLSKVHGNLKNR